jgi:hypothetical protein
LLSIVSRHFLHCMACLICVYFTPAYTMEGITLGCGGGFRRGVNNYRIRHHRHRHHPHHQNRNLSYNH